MPAIGRGVREIRVWDPSGTFRVIYVATIGETVFVLHCFGKKTRKTDRHDLDVAKKRYRDLLSDERP
jgi:phage-related protein